MAGAAWGWEASLVLLVDRARLSVTLDFVKETGGVIGVTGRRWRIHPSAEPLRWQSISTPLLPVTPAPHRHGLPVLTPIPNVPIPSVRNSAHPPFPLFPPNRPLCLLRPGAPPPLAPSSSTLSSAIFSRPRPCPTIVGPGPVSFSPIASSRRRRSSAVSTRLCSSTGPTRPAASAPTCPPCFLMRVLPMPARAARSAQDCVGPACCFLASRCNVSMRSDLLGGPNLPLLPPHPAYPLSAGKPFGLHRP